MFGPYDEQPPPLDELAAVTTGRRVREAAMEHAVEPNSTTIQHRQVLFLDVEATATSRP